MLSYADDISQLVLLVTTVECNPYKQKSYVFFSWMNLPDSALSSNSQYRQQPDRHDASLGSS